MKKTLIIILILISLGGYICLSIYSSNISLVTKTIEYIENGQIVKKSILEYPFEKNLVDILSQICLTGFIGIIISVLITKTIEEQRANRDKEQIDIYKKEKEAEIAILNEKINESVFDALFKKMVHEPTFHLVKEQIFKSKAIRKNAHWFFTFKENSNGSLDLCHQVVYELENAGHEPLLDPIILSTDEKTDLPLRSAHAVIDGVTILDFLAKDHFKKDASGEFVSENEQVDVGKDENNNYRVNINTEIPAHKTAGFTLEYLNKFENEYIRDGYFTKYPLIDVLIKFSYPKDWELDVFFTIRTDSTIIDNKEGSYMVKIDGGFLPGQGCVYTLNKK